MYLEQDVVRIAKRENNTKRSYLVINELQGKHIPVKPSKAFKMFRELAVQLKDEYANETLLLVGFAETATAIGAAVAGEIGSLYMQTTREIIPNVEYLFFSEEHSHATEQKLVKNDIDRVRNTIDRIIFIEDEVTTGKTILNIINILEKKYPQIKNYSVASLLNGMNEECLKRYSDRGIKLHYLVKTNHDRYAETADGYMCDGEYICSTNTDDITIEGVDIIEANSYLNTRRIVDMHEYIDCNLDLWKQIQDNIDIKDYKNILVIGTEEFMYPALYVANKIEEMGYDVRCHSTTRSPISVSKDIAYPLHTRYELRSFYDSSRITFIYDINRYDYVIIITDANYGYEAGLYSLVGALKKSGNNNISLVRWCEK